jgi:FtsH-binding integral membrane protein
MSATVKSPGPNRRRVRPAAWLAWGPSLLVVAVLLATLVLFELPDETRSSAKKLSDLVLGLTPILAFAAVGALILSRRPRNVIGWLCWAIGFTWSLATLGSDPAARRVAAGPVTIPAALALKLGQVAFLLSLLGLLPLLVLLFPTGRLPSRRWRPVVWVFTAGLLLYAGSVVLQPGQLHKDVPARNPLGLESAEEVLQLTGAALFWLFALLVVLVLGSLVLRFRRSRGEERQQLKWLTYAAALLVVLLPTVGGVLERIDPKFVGEVFFALAISMIPAAIGVAVLKYRLYDIDRIINRTLVYGLLTALLAGVYAGVVLVLGQLFGGISAEPPSWVVAGATLAVAALFQPARRRIQAAVDRRFNRRRYDAAKTIEAFSARLRDELDLDTLSAELLTVVEQSVQPTRASLWLRPSAKGSRRAGT